MRGIDSGMPSSPLLSVPELSRELGRPGLVVFDASYYLAAAGRDAHAEYRAAHIPGAVYFDVDALSDAASPLPHMLLPPAAFAEAIGRLGAGDSDRIVVYDTSGTNFSAARAWWMFRVYGHDDVAVLDGGLAAWKRAGLPVESGEVSRPPARFTPRYRPELVRTLAEVRDALEAGTAQVVDARSAGRFAGTEPEPRPGLRGGQCPAAGTFPMRRSPALTDCCSIAPAWREKFREAGVDLDQPVIASCGSGVTACTILLALDLLGHADHRIV